ncbi:hypothetical protein L249_6427 [Ophiocordyceps polyrhachis-furcata BCC 54312]|uniref:Uncharacterized protein n=1 Tax=Ophiocordyceps polyrhachis-furcata BCC 54312 TaxID=1330021 RepID=A0A367LL43_9HYPO|nr:hypothetical protein L249_6427 [Ophiocordyceps polyrhachis-furcata BCC 54312]
MISEDMAQPAHACQTPAISQDPWIAARSSFAEPYGNAGFSGGLFLPSSISYPTGAFPPTGFAPSALSNGLHGNRVLPTAAAGTTPGYAARPPPAVNTAVGSSYGSFQSLQSSWEAQDRYSPTGSLDEIMASPNLSDYSAENGINNANPRAQAKAKAKRATQRRPSNRDEFDGPHQFLQRPPPEVIAMQERELPHLPTNLHVQEQDNVLNQVNDRLSQCAYDFVAKYQFPIPLTQDMRPVERPQDREWTEWVYLLKRLATKRRIPARVLYNGQIKQFVTILENSLEMRHAAKHQSRPLKDDRNILQLISAGIQVAKILKDASAMEYLDRLYVNTDKRIQERTASRFRP